MRRVRPGTFGAASLLVISLAACNSINSPTAPGSPSVSDATIASATIATLDDAPFGKLNVCHYPKHGIDQSFPLRDFLVTGPGGFCDASAKGKIITISCSAEAGHKILPGNQNQQDYRAAQCGA